MICQRAPALWPSGAHAEAPRVAPIVLSGGGFNQGPEVLFLALACCPKVADASAVSPTHIHIIKMIE